MNKIVSVDLQSAFAKIALYSFPSFLEFDTYSFCLANFLFIIHIFHKVKKANVCIYYLSKPFFILKKNILDGFPLSGQNIANNFHRRLNFIGGCSC